MRILFLAVVLVLWGALSWADQPHGIILNPNGVSRIYPVVDVAGWTLTQPDYARMYSVPDKFRVTHFGDDYYAQDWARGCGKTHGQRLYAGISGQVVFAGSRGPYGLTVVVYDQESRFALKYSHLSETNVSMGDWVLAGKSLVGRVGNTGNVQTSGCQTHAGAHLHLSLHKQVTNPQARPVTSTYAASGAGPTGYAAPFEYAFSADLVKAGHDPTVFVQEDWKLYPVSATSFETHGWNFDKNNLMIAPVQNVAALSGYMEYNFWPLREGSTFKAENNPQVYVFQDGRKFSLTFDEFTCRGLRFGEIRSSSHEERDRYLPVQDTLAYGCRPLVKQSLADWARFSQNNPQFVYPDWSGYVYHADWDTYWDLRSLRFRHISGGLVNVYLTNARHDPSERYIGYFMPGSGEWMGWYRVN